MTIKYKLLSVFTFVVIASSAQAQNTIFERIYDETLAQASYIIGNDKKEVIVIDPKRDMDTYIDFAQKNNLKIKYVTETHIHADFLSGARELALATNADLLLSDEGGKDWQYEFPHKGLKDGQIIDMGNITLKVMHTPGHTPESIVFLVSDSNNSKDPIKAITGDFIFVGDVGRPDLIEKVIGQKDAQFAGADQMFESLRKFVKLPKDTEIWPGHGAGSFCGKSLSTIPQSTLEEEMKNNKAFQFLNDKKAFTSYILDGQPEPPKYFAVMKKWNKQMRPLVIEIPKISKLNQTEINDAIQNNVLVIDTRKKEMVANGFIPGSLHIENGKSFATFVGSLIAYDNQIILIANDKEMEDLTRKLMRIGFDNIYGYVSDVTGFDNLQKAKLIDSDQLKQQIKKGNIQIIDVRTPAEYESGHIKGAQNIPLNTLANQTEKINKKEPIVIHCQSGARAAMAYSVLEKLGFKNIINYSGGINDWTNNKNPLEKSSVKEKQ